MAKIPTINIAPVSSVEDLRRSVEVAMNRIIPLINNEDFTTDVSANNNRLTQVGRPTQGGDAVNLDFLNNQLSKMGNAISTNVGQLVINGGGGSVDAYTKIQSDAKYVAQINGTALQAAINSGVGEIIIVPGTTTFTSPITLGSTNTQLLISGKGVGSVLHFIGTLGTNTGFIDATGAQDITFRDMTITGSVGTATGILFSNIPNNPLSGSPDPLAYILSSNSTIWLHGGCKNVKFENVTFKNTGGYVAVIDARTGSDISNVIFERCTFENNHPHVFGTSTADLSYGAWTGGIIYVNNGTATSDPAVKSLTVHNCKFSRGSGNQIWGHGYGFQSFNTDINITNNRFKDIGLDCSQFGNTIGGSCNDNQYHRIGYVCIDNTSTSVPKFLAGSPAFTAVCADTAGMVEGVTYADNIGVSVNGELVDADGLCSSSIINNTIIVPKVGTPLYTTDQISLYGVGTSGNITKGIVVNNSSNQTGGENLTISNNTIINCGGGGIAGGSLRNSKVIGNNIQSPSVTFGEFGPITLFNLGTATNQQATGNSITANLIDITEAIYCVQEIDAVFGSTNTFNSTSANIIYNNICFGSNSGEFGRSPNSASSVGIVGAGNLPGIATTSIYRVGTSTGTVNTRATQFVKTISGTDTVLMQIGDANALLNVSVNGSATTGNITTGNISAVGFNDSVVTRRLLSAGGFLGLQYTTLDTSAANSLDGSWLLLRNNAGVLEYSTSTNTLGRIWFSGGAGTNTAAGSNTWIQYNAGGSFGASGNLTFGPVVSGTLTNPRVLNVIAASNIYAGINCQVGYIQSDQGFLVNTSTVYNSIYTPGGVYTLNGYTTDQALYLKATTTSTTLNTPGAGYSGLAYHGSNSFYYYNSTTTTWNTVDFGSIGSGVTAVFGTSQQISVSANTGSVTISLPSAIAVQTFNSTATGTNVAFQANGGTGAIITGAGNMSAAGTANFTGGFQSAGYANMVSGYIVGTYTIVDSAFNAQFNTLKVGGSNTQIDASGNISALNVFSATGTGGGFNVTTNTAYNSIQTVGGVLATQVLATQATFGNTAFAPTSAVTAISTNSANPRGVSVYQINNAASPATFNFFKARGTISSPLAITTGDLILNIVPNGYDGTAYIPASRITMAVDGTVTTGIVPGNIQFQTMNQSGVISNKMIISAAGLVTIGTPSNPTQSVVVDQAGNISYTGTLAGNASGSGVNITTNTAFNCIQAPNGGIYAGSIFFGMTSDGPYFSKSRTSSLPTVATGYSALQHNSTSVWNYYNPSNGWQTADFGLIGGGVLSLSTSGGGIGLSASTGNITISNTGITSIVAGSGVTLTSTNTISIGQPVATSATPTFAGVISPGAFSSTITGTGIGVQVNGTGGVGVQIFGNGNINASGNANFNQYTIGTFTAIDSGANFNGATITGNNLIINGTSTAISVPNGNIIIGNGILSSTNSSFQTINIPAGGIFASQYSWQGRSSPGLSAGGDAVMYFDSGSNQLMLSQNGGGYVSVLTSVAAGTGVTISTNTISIGQNVSTSASVTFGALTVSGNIGMSGILTSANTSYQTINIGGGGIYAGQYSWQGRSSPGLSGGGTAVVYFDSSSNSLQVSQNGGSYQALVGITSLSGGTGVNITGTNTINIGQSVGMGDSPTFAALNASGTIQSSVNSSTLGFQLYSTTLSTPVFQIYGSGFLNCNGGYNVNGNAAISSSAQFVGAGGVSTNGSINTSSTGTFQTNVTSGSYYLNGGSLLLDSYSRFVGSGGVNTSGSIVAVNLSLSGTASISGTLSCNTINSGTINASGVNSINAGGSMQAANFKVNSGPTTVIGSTGFFVGAGVNTSGSVTCAGVISSGGIAATGFNINGGGSGQTWTINFSGGFVISGIGTYHNMIFQGGVLVSAS